MSAYAWRGGVVSTYGVATIPAMRGMFCLLPGDQSCVVVPGTPPPSTCLPIIVDVGAGNLSRLSEFGVINDRLDCAAALVSTEAVHHRHDDVSREIVRGLCLNKTEGWAVLAGLGKCDSAETRRSLLATAGIKETHVTRDRSDLVADLTGWPGAAATRTAGYGGVPLRDCGSGALRTRLLRVTRNRRLLAHLHEHKWVLRRLCSWNDRPVPMPDLVCGNDASIRVALGFGSSLRRLALFGSHLVHLGLVPSPIDSASHVGALLRAAANVMHLNAPDPTQPLDLADTAGMTQRWPAASAVVRELHALLGRTGRATTIISGGGRVLAPMGLRTYAVPAGPVLVYETHDPIPLARRREVRALLGNLARILGLSAAHASELRGPVSVGVTLGPADRVDAGVVRLTGLTTLDAALRIG